MKMSKGLLPFPYSKVEPRPSAKDPIVTVCVDRELAGEGFTYVLESGKEGTVHSEQVLGYNQDPNYLRDAVLYRLTIEAQKRAKVSPLSKREIIRTYLKIVDGLPIHPYKLGHASPARRSMGADSGVLS
jgi:hypothetical protein